MKKIATLLFGTLASFSALAQPCAPNTKSIKFDGSTSYIDLGTAANLAPDSAVTVEAWIKASAFATNSWQNTVVSKDGWSQGEGGFSLRCGGNGILSFNIAGKTFAGASSSWKEALSPASAITLNTWTHVAGVFDGATVKCFVNGVQVGSTVFAGVIDKNALYQTRVGRLSDNQGVSQYRNFNGYIDEVRIWERALTPAELLANMNVQINPVGQSRLRGYWRFNEGSGTTTGDLGSGNNAGTITSALWDNAVPFSNAIVSSAISGPASVAPATSTSYAVSTHAGSSYLWSATNGTVTAGQNTSSVTILWGAAGPASIQMIESNAFCSDTAQLSLWVGSVGISESSAKNNISLVPNPIKDKATFTFPVANNTVIRIMDMLGNEVLVLSAENKSSISFNRAELTSGIYFYQVISDKKNVATGKMLVE
jgi:Concanavalin A-like lectin/glucanases superfamily/Secretion system C-terminal sorting domain